MEEGTNQCDGCRRGLLVRDGIHYDGDHPWIGCTAGRYPEAVPPEREVYPCDRCERPTTNEPHRTFILCDDCRAGKPLPSHAPEAPERLLEKATVRLEIIRGRLAACDHAGDHGLSLLELDGWIEEQRAALRSSAPATGEP